MIPSSLQKHNQYSGEIGEISDALYKGTKSILEAKEILRKLHDDNILIEGKFESEIWKLKSPNENYNTRIYFTLNNEETPPPYSIPLSVWRQVKCWAAERLLVVEPKTVQRNVFCLKQALTVSNSFDHANVELLIEHLTNYESDPTKDDIFNICLNFLDYSNLPNKEEYINELRMVRGRFKSPHNVRTLPNYSDVLKFQLILEYFSKTWSYEEKCTYFPILLWWKITNVIPLRPSEFCDIPRQCLFAKNGSFFMKLPRKKQKGTLRNVEVIDSVAISENIYKLVQEYMSLTEGYGESKTLLHYNATKAYLRTNTWFLKRDPLSFFYSNLNNILEKFYTEIIEKKYDIYNLDRITPNDTRHFAFCNLMLQGMNALTIARLGGHRNVESQYHYQQHMDYFTESKIFHLTRTIQLQKYSEFNEIVSNIELEQAKTNALRDRSNFDFLDEMEIGYCTDRNKDCESEYCQFCKKWWISLEELYANEEKLRDITELKKQQIKVRLESMERIRKDMEYDFQKNTHAPYEQELLTKESKLLNGDIIDLARLQSYLNQI
ncbi:tyrosine-type recombinase/integrase [Paenibacillus alginolyticus]|uniref:Site-specific integrase n=1 Tax=Paenibacillus alginolyticus TaxID=59839 RepID=A0ABT4GED1_9BACL|nr:tyrosine-type recombinase/integrase [Paenibacillus alginolyticus]MCY9694547.1 site-specific integrase [Paenibacillus alginolyticus]MEC0142708.1 tyrosine-type recombinase/integrase [Paenibacillus alginolyticus]